jgi:superfamily II DNA helicase RecQ
LRETGCPAAFLNSSLNIDEYNQVMDEILNNSPAVQEERKVCVI